MELPTLYTLNSNQGTRYWKISVTTDRDAVNICREYGKHGGKAIINKKLITETKSRSTVYDQAVFEATNDWNDMQNKKGYVMEIKTLTSTSSQLQTASPISPCLPPTPPPSPTNDEPSDVQTVAVQTVLVPMVAVPTTSFKFLPMLANKFLERKKYVTYPCMVQPKLDGVRYTARKLSADQVSIKTRSDSECPFFHQIKAEIQHLEIPPNIILDGEFYSKRIPFKTLNGYCNRKKIDGKTGFNTIPSSDLETIHYYVFDCYFIDQPDKSFGERYQYLESLPFSKYLKLVPVTRVKQESELMPLHDQFVEQGYEGLMVRNINSPYKLKDRSNNLLKYKNFFDTEFTIIGAKCPTNGKEEGCIIWILKLSNSEETFTCRPRDTYESRKSDWDEYNSDPNQFIGKLYTVRFQEKYDNGIPRFPVGIAIRYDLGGT